MTFCDAAHNDIAAEYPGLYNVSIDVVVPPIILKAMGWYETWERQYPDGGGWLRLGIDAGADRDGLRPAIQ